MLTMVKLGYKAQKGGETHESRTKRDTNGWLGTFSSLRNSLLHRVPAETFPALCHQYQHWPIRLRQDTERQALLVATVHNHRDEL